MKKNMLAISALMMAAFAFTSCDKDDDTPMAKAKLQVVHASPDAPNVDVRANGNIVKSNLAYPTNTGYLSLDAGSYKLQVSPTGTTTYVIDTTTSLEADKSYSVFAIGQVAGIAPAITVDNLTAPASGKAHVRFFHFSPTAPAVDVALAGGDVLFGNRQFNDQNTNTAFQAFSPLDAGTYNLEVRVAGTNTVALPLGNITLEAGKIYTVFAKGLLAGTGTQALGAEIIANN